MKRKNFNKGSERLVQVSRKNDEFDKRREK